MRFILWVPVLLMFASCEPNLPGFANPTVTIAVLVRNKAQSLPYFLSCLVKLSYPKARIHLWLYTDHNEDNSLEILQQWVRLSSTDYGAVNFYHEPDGQLPHSKGPTSWDTTHMDHVIQIREKALAYAQNYTDYLFMLDADVYLTNQNTLDLLVDKHKIVVAPMLNSEGLYSNFWAGMNENFYYKRTDEYKPILHREMAGCHKVPMVHSAVLIHVADRLTHKFTYDRDKMIQPIGPRDDIITFALSVHGTGHLPLLCNDDLYGFIQLPLTDVKEWKNEERLALSHIILEALAAETPLPLNKELEPYAPPPPEYEPLPVNRTYLINLPRRTDRRVRMEASLRELQIDAHILDAYDGLDIDMDNLRKYRVKLMPGYEDPYHKRPMKAGEVGCFLSHYQIWREVQKEGISSVLVLEDDVRFGPYFRRRLHQLFEEVKDRDWDLVYLGRKVLNAEEEFVTEHLVKPSYSYWTLGYVINEKGANKLLEARPLKHLLPVDEFLPIMFDQHPNETWKSYFADRRLVALSAEPLLVTPTHYTGEPGYVSDTEDSSVLQSPREEL